MGKKGCICIVFRLTLVLFFSCWWIQDWTIITVLFLNVNWKLINVVKVLKGMKNKPFKIDLNSNFRLQLGLFKDVHVWNIADTLCCLFLYSYSEIWIMEGCGFHLGWLRSDWRTDFCPYHTNPRGEWLINYDLL